MCWVMGEVPRVALVGIMTKNLGVSAVSDFLGTFKAHVKISMRENIIKSTQKFSNLNWIFPIWDFKFQLAN